MSDAPTIKNLLEDAAMPVSAAAFYQQKAQLDIAMHALSCLAHARGGKLEVDLSALSDLRDKGVGMYMDPDNHNLISIELEDMTPDPVPKSVSPFVHAMPGAMQ